MDASVGARAKDVAESGPAIEAESALAETWAARFGLLGDVNRLRIMLALHRAPGLNVGELAEAVGMTDNAVSHALSGLRIAGAVGVQRDGRYRRWSIVDADVHDVLHIVGASHSELHPPH